MFMKHHANVTILKTTNHGWTALETVRIDANHPLYGHGRVDLDNLQAEHIHARLSQIDFAFTHRLQTEPLVTTLSRCGADALPVTTIENDEVRLLALVIQNGDGKVYRAPDEIAPVRKQLEHVVVEYLHDQGWGGEDGRNQ
jgi:hypothetical protein